MVQTPPVHFRCPGLAGSLLHTNALQSWWSFSMAQLVSLLTTAEPEHALPETCVAAVAVRMPLAALTVQVVCVVGGFVGAAVGGVGAFVGAFVGGVGAFVGASVGGVGAFVGASVGAVGVPVGAFVGGVGAFVGALVATLRVVPNA